MKLHLALCAALLTATAYAQTNQQDSLWIIQHYHKIESRIPMRDGVKLFTSLYIPNDTTENHPLLIKRTPYSCAPYGEQQWPDYWNSHEKYYFREG